MQDDLDKLLKLLEQSFNTTDLSKLKSLEKEISQISSNIKSVIDSSENNDDQFNRDDIEKLGNLINKISLKQKDHKSFLSDFQNFIKDRKIN